MARTGTQKNRSGKSKSINRNMKHRCKGASPQQRERTWRSHIRQWKQSGQTQAEFCRGRHLSLSTFRWWRSELNRRDRQEGPRSRAAPEKRNGKSKPTSPGPSLSFVPVQVVEPAAENPQGGPSCLEIVLRGGRRIVLGTSFDAGVLEQVVAALERIPC